MISACWIFFSLCLISPNVCWCIRVKKIFLPLPYIVRSVIRSLTRFGSLYNTTAIACSRLTKNPFDCVRVKNSTQTTTMILSRRWAHALKLELFSPCIQPLAWIIAGGFLCRVYIFFPSIWCSLKTKKYLYRVQCCYDYTQDRADIRESTHSRETRSRAGTDNFSLRCCFLLSSSLPLVWLYDDELCAEREEGIDNVKILIVSHLRKLSEEQHLKNISSREIYYNYFLSRIPHCISRKIIFGSYNFLKRIRGTTRSELIKKNREFCAFFVVN